MGCRHISWGGGNQLAVTGCHQLLMGVTSMCRGWGLLVHSSNCSPHYCFDACAPCMSRHPLRSESPAHPRPRIPAACAPGTYDRSQHVEKQQYTRQRHERSPYAPHAGPSDVYEKKTRLGRRWFAPTKWLATRIRKWQRRLCLLSTLAAHLPLPQVRRWLGV
jgi:hypothetical protein